MLIDPLRNMASYKKLLEDIKSLRSPISISGLIEENIGHIAYALNQHADKPILVIVHSEAKAQRIYDDIKNFDERVVELLPEKEIMFYKVDAISTERSVDRLRVLSRLAKGEPIIVVAHIDAVLSKFTAPNIFKESSLSLRVGDVVDLKDLAQRLVQCGYKRENMVEAVGQFSIRGGIVDFFPPNCLNPYRIELFDDEVDSIRTFEVETQRSIEMVQSLFLPPVKEILILEDYRQTIIENMMEELNSLVKNKKLEHKIKEKIEDKFGAYIGELEEDLYISNMDMLIPYIPEEYISSILDYFSKDCLVFIDEPTRIEERASAISEQYLMRYSDVLELGEVLPSHMRINYEYEDLLDKIKDKVCIINTAITKTDRKFNPVSVLKFAAKSMQSFHNNIELFNKELNYYKYRGYKVIVFSGSPDKGKNLYSSLMDLDTLCNYSDDLKKEIKSSQVFIVPGSIHGGFEYSDIKLAVIGDKDIYGSIKESRKAKKKPSKDVISFADLKIGDYVVHENHGIGQYSGVEQLNIQGVVKDYLVINYKGNDKLYVPIDQMNLIQKYIGGDSVKPKINRLSSPEWVRVKQRARKAVEDMAKDLLELYAKRETVKGFAFSPDTVWQKQFEDAFPYEETEAQIRSVEEIKKDMEKERPMDRLLCGDVGYGKTEVALRAAFKAVMDGKQVAFLVPTTILAQQHYNTIVDRFKDYPVSVDVLSRFKSPKDQKRIVEGLEKGLVDIVVGTHRLLSKDVKFKDLGLLIVDEEQRFGVKHKEALKKMKENVDVLTLTATPIPRTLHMSLIGVRDMSVIDEPPGQRYPIETYVVEFNEQMVREAILKELNRGGQVYYVYNRVEDIDKMASRLNKLVPEANIVIGHGQMSEKELEKIMMDFIDQKYNVLVCTTIIETGLDIPNVNTIIVYDADKMGLSQLYQLRGRVGRTDRIAYAYFTYEKNKVLTEVAEKRLKAIKDFTEFGSGFKVAMRDLEIRGTGNLLGVEQHGHIATIGYDLYVKFLNQAIRKLKGEIVEETVDTTIDLSVDGYIPTKYIEDEEQKIEIYKKIAAVKDDRDYSELVDELVDRFGDLPKEVENLLDISYIKNNAGDYHIQNITQSNKVITLEFSSAEHISPDLIHYLAEQYGKAIGFDLSKTPSFSYKYRDDLLNELKDVINNIRTFFNKR
ncbi:MAG: transcription-repair coupling factor [Tissierellia bacterium]|nr:transcription-repair coupling factor [Tissierellia bacterium]